MRIDKQKLVSVVAMAAGLSVVALPALATTIVPACARGVEQEAPQLWCLLQTFRNVANFIVGVSGSFALLMFVWGGFQWITSAGNEKKVSSGKTILTNAVIGIILIFSSGYVVDYIVGRLMKNQTAISVGQACNNNRGKYDNQNGVLTCVTPCSAMASDGYSCRDPQGGEDCNASYSGCSGGTVCCITPLPTR